jgi:hypothetical protein
VSHMPIPKPPLTFATPSVVSDTPEARAKVERDYKEIVRGVVRYLGPKRVAELNKEIAMARRGNKPNRSLNDLVLAEWDASPTKDPTKFSKAFLQKHPQGHSEGAVKARLKRERTARIKTRRKDRKLRAALQRPSFVGEARGTE